MLSCIKTCYEYRYFHHTHIQNVTIHLQLSFYGQNELNSINKKLNKSPNYGGFVQYSLWLGLIMFTLPKIFLIRAVDLVWGKRLTFVYTFESFRVYLVEKTPCLYVFEFYIIPLSLPFQFKY